MRDFLELLDEYISEARNAVLEIKIYHDKYD